MIGALLTKIGGLFEKEYLFASFLPALIFVTAIVASLAPLTGVEALSSWIDSWSTLQKAVVSAATGIFVVVVGYVLHGLRPFFTTFWSGNTNWWPLKGFLWIGVQLQRVHYLHVRERARRISPWRSVLDDFGMDVKRVWSKNHPTAPADELASLKRIVAGLNERLGKTHVKAQLAPLWHAYRKYNIDSLGDIYKALKDRLDEWEALESARIQRDTATLDRRFGSLATLKATGLGNVIESFNRYPFTRYGIEVEIFWPRLQYVMKKEFLATVRDQRILLDFSLTLASLAAVYVLFAIFAGPWIWFNTLFWFVLAAIAAAVCLFFYFLAVDAAEQLGDLVRSSFDLFRLDLMMAIGLDQPASITAERSAWNRLSEFVVYGQLPEDVVLRKRPEKPEK